MNPHRRRRLIVIAGAGIALLAAAMLDAAPLKPYTPTLVAPAHYVTYDAGFSRWRQAPRTVEMSQGVTFQQDDAVLKMDAAVVNLDDSQNALSAKSLSPVHMYDSQNDLRGEHGFVDFTRHLTTLTDNIILVARPGGHNSRTSKGSLGGQFKDTVTLTCAAMTYDYRRKLGRVPGALTVHQKDRVLTADSGEYSANAQTVTLTGHVHALDSRGNVIDAPLVVVGIQEGNESVTVPAPTHGTFNVKGADDSGDENVPPAPTHSPPPATSNPDPLPPLTP